MYGSFFEWFFDSEECVDENGYIEVYNTDLRLLEYVKELLQRLGIESTGSKPGTRQGTILHDPKTGKRYVRNRDCYNIRVRASSNANFYKTVGFTIRRKQTTVVSG